MTIDEINARIRYISGQLDKDNPRRMTEGPFSEADKPVRDAYAREMELLEEEQIELFKLKDALEAAAPGEGEQLIANFLGMYPFGKRGKAGIGTLMGEELGALSEEGLAKANVIEDRINLLTAPVEQEAEGIMSMIADTPTDIEEFQQFVSDSSGLTGEEREGMSIQDSLERGFNAPREDFDIETTYEPDLRFGDYDDSLETTVLQEIIDSDKAITIVEDEPFEYDMEPMEYMNQTPGWNSKDYGDTLFDALPKSGEDSNFLVDKITNPTDLQEDAAYSLGSKLREDSQLRDYLYWALRKGDEDALYELAKNRVGEDAAEFWVRDLYKEVINVVDGILPEKNIGPQGRYRIQPEGDYKLPGLENLTKAEAEGARDWLLSKRKTPGGMNPREYINSLSLDERLELYVDPLEGDSPEASLLDSDEIDYYEDIVDWKNIPDEYKSDSESQKYPTNNLTRAFLEKSQIMERREGDLVKDFGGEPYYQEVTDAMGRSKIRVFTPIKGTDYGTGPKYSSKTFNNPAYKDLKDWLLSKRGEPKNYKAGGYVMNYGDYGRSYK